MPVRQRWQVIVVEDADRLHERANNALLKAIEEPTPRTVWMLCAPQPTTSCRPSAPGPATSAWRPRGRRRSRSSSPGGSTSPRPGPRTPRGPARGTSAGPRRWRSRSRHVAGAARWSGCRPGLTSLGACMTAAQNLVEIATAEATAQTDETSAKEAAEPRRPLRHRPAGALDEVGEGRGRSSSRQGAEGAVHPQGARRRGPVADRAALGLPRRPLRPDRRRRRAGQRGGPTGRRGASPAGAPRRARCAGSTRSTRPASGCSSSTSHPCWRWSR